jgi:hypothetical protein
MASAAQQKFDETLSRIDSVLDSQLRRVEAVERRAEAEREEARRVRMRDAMHERVEIGSRYADAYRSFGTEVPAPVDDEAPSAYRRRLFNRLVRRLPSDHKLAQIRPDDLGSQAVVFDNFEAMLLAAAALEGSKPSIANLPEDGSIIERHRVDDMGQRMTEFYGRESFIKDFGRPGRRVRCIRDAKTGQAIWGNPLPQAR